jgi:hypothetical protein
MVVEVLRFIEPSTGTRIVNMSVFRATAHGLLQHGPEKAFQAK